MTIEPIKHFLSFIENYDDKEEFWEEVFLGNIEEDHPFFKDLEAFESIKQFLENVYEIAFGNDAINKNYSLEEVLERLKEFSNNAFKWEEENA